MGERFIAVGLAIGWTMDKAFGLNLHYIFNLFH